MSQSTRVSGYPSRAIAAFAALAGICAALVLCTDAASAAEVVPVATAPGVASWAYLAAGLSTALGTIGAGYAVGRVGSAAVGAIAEKPELFGRALVLVGLAEGIAIYGLIVSILILNRIT
jgi:V/A-type H+-transporting ATPase subunit K